MFWCGLHLQDSAYIQHAKHSQGGRNDQEKVTRSLRRWIRNCPRIKASGWQMVALITWKEGETKGVRLQNSTMSLKLQGQTSQLSFCQMWRESAFSLGAPGTLMPFRIQYCWVDQIWWGHHNPFLQLISTLRVIFQCPGKICNHVHQGFLQRGFSLQARVWGWTLDWRNRRDWRMERCGHGPLLQWQEAQEPRMLTADGKLPSLSAKRDVGEAAVLLLPESQWFHQWATEAFSKLRGMDSGVNQNRH